MAKLVKVVLVGDAKTGKSSLITAAVTNEFSRTVVSLLPPITEEPLVGKDKPTRKYVDTSDKRELLLENKRKRALQSADVVCVVYDVTRPQTFDNVARRWMPEIISLGVTVPVVLIGNKLDARKPDDRASMAVRQRIVPLVQTYGNQIEWALECSARTMERVNEAFTKATEAVLYPSGPLFDSGSQRFLAALANIFKQLDYDRDGFLSDDELLAYQRCCSPSVTEAIVEKLKGVVRKFSPDSIRADGQVSLDGFVVIHQFLVENSKFPAIWALLTAHGYGKDLLLTKEFLLPSIGLTDGGVTQLGVAGFRFILEQFERFDADKDGLLNAQEQKEMYETSPSDPFRYKASLMSEATEGHPEAVSENGLISLWCMKALENPKEVSKYLRFLGYKGVMQEAIEVYPERRPVADGRHTFSCYLLGSSGCGKTAVLRNHLGKLKNSPAAEYAVNTVNDGEENNYLAIREFSEHAAAHLVAAEGEEDAKSLLSGCDVVAVAYDVQDIASFHFATNVYEAVKKADKSVPCVFLACKSDRPFAEYPSGAVGPEQYCKAQKLIEPIPFSRNDIGTEDPSSLFRQLVQIARYPDYAVRRTRRNWRTALGLGFVGALAVGVGTLVFTRPWNMNEVMRFLRPFLVMPNKLLTKE